MEYDVQQNEIIWKKTWWFRMEMMKPSQSKTKKRGMKKRSGIDYQLC